MPDYEFHWEPDPNEFAPNPWYHLSTDTLITLAVVLVTISLCCAAMVVGIELHQCRVA